MRLASTGNSLWVQPAAATALAIASAATLWCLLTRKRVKRPPREPLMFPTIWETIAYLADPTEFAMSKFKKFGGTFAAKLMGEESFFLAPTAANLKFFTGLKDLGWPRHFKDVVGHKAVSMVNDPLHKSLRTIYNRAFTQEKLDSYLPIIGSLTQSHLQKWASWDEPQDARAAVKLYTFDVAQQILLGVNVGPEETMQYMMLFDDTFTLGLGSMLPFELPGLQFRTAMRARRTLISKYQGLIEEKRANPPKVHDSMLDIVMFGNPAEQPDDVELQDFCLNMTFAGHDTTLASMQTLFHLLDANPALQEELRSEVDSIWEAEMTRSLLGKAPKCRAFIAETLRLVPPVTRVPRKMHSDAVVDGYSFPKGTCVALSPDVISHVHNTDPEQISLRRHMDEKGDFVDRTYEFKTLPAFGVGARMCIGYKFALDELAVFLITLLHGFTFKVETRKQNKFPFNYWKVVLSLQQRARQ